MSGVITVVFAMVGSCEIIKGAACGEKQETLHGAMGEEVKDGGAIGADAAGHHHEPKLTDRRVGQNALDVDLRESDHGGKEGGHATDDRHHVHDGRGQHIQRCHADQEVHARIDHGRGVDQRGNRGRGFHRKREPDVEGNLRGLADRSHEQQQRNHGEDGGLPLQAEPSQEIHRLVGVLRRGGQDRLNVERAEGGPGHVDAECEADIRHPIDEKGFCRGIAGRGTA